MRVVLAGGGTGGHLYPAIAIARALVALAPSVRPFFIGARRGIEREILPTTEFAHELLDLHPLYRARPWQNWRTVRGLVSAWRRLGALMDEARPSVVVGTGGYAAGAMLAWAARHRLPTVIQEQNSHPGITVRFFSRFADEIHLGFPEAARWLTPRRGARVVDTGNPIAPPPPRPDRAAARATWGFPDDDGRVLLIFGGSQGARAINEIVAEWIQRGLPDGLRVIWGTGTAQAERYAHLESDRVRVRGYLAPITDAYAAADLALVRAGAMTTAELCAWGIPMILVPLPTAAADHQTANARALESAGAAVHVAQSELSPDALDRRVRALIAEPDRLRQLAAGALARARPEAAENIARRILTLADLKQLHS